MWLGKLAVLDITLMGWPDTPGNIPGIKQAKYQALPGIEKAVYKQIAYDLSRKQKGLLVEYSLKENYDRIRMINCNRYICNYFYS